VCIGRMIGSGINTFFCTDPWLEGSPLCVHFRRLFNMAENRSISVVDMCGLWWEERGGGLAVALSIVSMGGGAVRGV
jgi:hypothetical protein